MDGSRETFEALGREVAETLGTGPDREHRAAQQQALLASLQAVGPARAARRPAIVAAAAAAALLLAAAAGYLLLRADPDEPLHFRVGEQLAEGQEGAWLEAPAGRELGVNFSDEAHLALEQGAAGRVLESRRRRVRVGLDRGRLRMNVRQKGARTWTVEAGPYRVSVVGTEFSVAWEPVEASFEVTVRSGRVQVHGAGLHRDGVVLEPGDRLVAERGRPMTVVGAGEPEAGAAPPDEAQEPAVAVEEDPRRDVASLDTVPRRARRARRGRAVPAGWRALHGEGRYAEALAVAQQQGFAELLTRLGAAELRELADTARFAGRGAEAEQALLALRERFPRDRRSRVAAFLLGRVAMDLAGRPDVAATWFETYLDEDRSGPLAEEALGRLVDARARAGQRARARAAAEQYLARYPQGVFGELARSVLKE